MGALQYLTGCKGPSGFGSASTAEEVAEKYKDQIKGKVVIVTGSNSGSGKETVKCLAQHGAKVIMACRNLEKCKQAAEDIKSGIPDADIISMQCDLASFESIRSFVKEFDSLNLPLNILINNAGIMALPLAHTKDGHEMQFGTNHLGPFLLTELLIKNLKQGQPARVVNLSSIAHQQCYKEGIRFDDLKGESYYSRLGAYGQSKLANILHAQELNQRFKENKLNITANAVHPGVFSSGLKQHSGIVGEILYSVFRPFQKNIQQGASTSMYVALAPELEGVGGKYFADCNELEPTIPGDNLRIKLREVSKQLTSADEL